ncbi:hypothetical protein QE152_g27540 [Popillia japonica]|uniref:Uncharacterized protein n=1 Tax=Popillia japonica TaxID=7064 RepID=A0AAW1JV52_POPJA
MDSGQYGEAGDTSAMELESNNYSAVLLKDSGRKEIIKSNIPQENLNVGSINDNNSITNIINSIEVNSGEKELLIVNNFEFKFSYLYNGPYYAYIQHSSKNIGRLHEMAVGRLLHEELGIKSSIKEVSKAGYNRIKVELELSHLLKKLAKQVIIV